VGEWAFLKKVFRVSGQGLVYKCVRNNINNNIADNVCGAVIMTS